MMILSFVFVFGSTCFVESFSSQLFLIYLSTVLPFYAAVKSDNNNIDYSKRYFLTVLLIN